MALVSRIRGSRGWQTKPPRSLPLEMKQDRARPVQSPDDRQMDMLCDGDGDPKHLQRTLPTGPQGARHSFIQ